MRSPAALLCLAALAAGCQGDARSSTRPAVLAAAYPFAWAAERVAGDDASVTNLVDTGVEPHDLELSPRQVASFQDARLVVYLRGFQPAVDDAVGEAPEDARLDVTSVADAEGTDPHVWLDPLRMRSIVEAVAGRLAEQDPDHAADYRRRATATNAELAALDEHIRSSLRDCARTELVTAHSAFAYLARRYGLTQVGITGLSPDAEPSPGRLAEVARFARTRGVTTIFFESLVDPALAKTVASEVGARTAVLDPVEGVATGDDYLSVMRRNAAALHDGLGCA